MNRIISALVVCALFLSFGVKAQAGTENETPGYDCISFKGNTKPMKVHAATPKQGGVHACIRNPATKQPEILQVDTLPDIKIKGKGYDLDCFDKVPGTCERIAALLAEQK